jgi:hypothetical protein
MNEKKKGSKPVRRRRSVRKFRRYSNAPAAANEKLEVSSESSIEEESLVVELDEASASELSSDFISEEQTAKADSSSVDSAFRKRLRRAAGPRGFGRRRPRDQSTNRPSKAEAIRGRRTPQTRARH